MGELSFTHIEGSGLLFKHDCMGTWASSWQMRGGGQMGRAQDYPQKFLGARPRSGPHHFCSHPIISLLNGGGEMESSCEYRKNRLWVWLCICILMLKHEIICRDRLDSAL